MDLAEARFDRVAKFYEALYSFVEWFASEHRKDILRQARGDILEVGVGTGSSLKDYLVNNNFHTATHKHSKKLLLQLLSES